MAIENGQAGLVNHPILYLCSLILNFESRRYKSLMKTAIALLLKRKFGGQESRYHSEPPRKVDFPFLSGNIDRHASFRVVLKLSWDWRMSIKEVNAYKGDGS
jgi:hypothetical protein